MTNLISNSVRLANSKDAPRCQGWDASDPDGCWMKDLDKLEAIDYTDGFRLFDDYDDALRYAETIDGTYLIRLDVEIDRWTVTPLGGGTYGS